MLDPKVEKFLEDNNMTYLFLLLANLEVERLNNLPSFVKNKLPEKIATVALEHIAKNEVPDYVVEQEEFEEETAE